MIDVTQTLLIIVITVLTWLLAVIGIQMIYILRALRQSVKKANKILEDASVLTAGVRKPIGNIPSIMGGIKAGIEVIRMLRDKGEEGKTRKA